jgi:hypothetical protein
MTCRNTLEKYFDITILSLIKICDVTILIIYEVCRYINDTIKNTANYAEQCVCKVAEPTKEN